MEYKILEAIGVENENVDGAALNNLSSRGESGVIPGVLNSCNVYVSGSSSVVVDTGELLINGFRVKILSPYSVQRTASSSDISHHIVAKIVLYHDKSVQFSMECRVASALTQDPIFVLERGGYEIEVARFMTGPNGIHSLKRTLREVGSEGYILTDEDMQEIADLVFNRLPVYGGEVTEV